MILLSIPSQNYSAQPRTFETPNPIDPSFSRMAVTLTRENWPGTPQDTIVEVAIDVALDGVTYGTTLGARSSFVGGVRQYQKDGQTITVTQERVEVTLMGVGLTTRKIRASLNNTLPLRTAVTVEAV